MSWLVLQGKEGKRGAGAGAGAGVGAGPLLPITFTLGLGYCDWSIKVET